MSLYKVNAAFAQAILASPLGTYPVAWEGKTFSPDYTQPWLEMINLPSMLEEIQTCDWAGGVIQLVVHHPINTYGAKLFQDADLLLSYFLPASLIEYNGQKVKIRNRYATSLTKNKDGMSISVMVGWRSVFEH